MGNCVLNVMIRDMKGIISRGYYNSYCSYFHSLLSLFTVAEASSNQETLTIVGAAVGAGCFLLLLILLLIFLVKWWVYVYLSVYCRFCVFDEDVYVCVCKFVV